MSGPITSSGNSTRTPLGSAATYTGTWEQDDRPDVMVSCQADNTGTLYFDFSNDGGTNFSTFPVNGFDVASGIHEFHVAVKGPRSFRVRLVNDSGAHTYLRLYSYYGTFAKAPNAPLNQTLGSDQDAAVVRSIAPMVDEALGRLGGVQARTKFGYTTGLGTAIQLGTPSTWVDLWAYGGLRTAPSGSFTPYMASDDNTDDEDITWQYLDASGLEQEVTVSLNGTTPVSLGVTATDVFTGWVDDATEPDGLISCASANNFTSGTPDNQAEVLAALPVLDNRTQVLAFRVPSNKQCLMKHLALTLSRTSGSAGAAIIVFQVRESGGVFQTRRPVELTSNAPVMENLEGMVVPASADVRVRIRDVSDASTNITGSLSYLLVDT